MPAAPRSQPVATVRLLTSLRHEMTGHDQKSLDCVRKDVRQRVASEISGVSPLPLPSEASLYRLYTSSVRAIELCRIISFRVWGSTPAFARCVLRLFRNA